MQNLYINIGTKKCCFFVKISIFLIEKLEKYPFLYYAVEEALECAKNEYYAIGIITFAQLLNIMNKKTPDSRHLIAHEILKVRPTKATFEKIKQEFKMAASEYNEREIVKYKNVSEYQNLVFLKWDKFLKTI
ncbi:MAG: hypothetical protein ABR969_01535 [Sedimentisphaerales bacterium]